MTKKKSYVLDKKPEIAETVELETVIEENTNEQFVEPELQKVRILVPALNIRRSPSMKAGVVDILKDKGGEYALKKIAKEGKWGQLEDETGWICLEFAELI